MFIAGLMVGRTPEYLGKKVQAYDVQMAMLVILVFPLTILVLTAISVVAPTFGIEHPQPRTARIVRDPLCVHVRDRQQRLGLRRSDREYEVVQHLAGDGDADRRFFAIIPMSRLPAASGARSGAPSAGTFPVTTPLFSALLVGVIVIVGALTFFPALSLGPMVEHLLMAKGQVF